MKNLTINQPGEPFVGAVDYAIALAVQRVS